jgi:hypothetical protein
VPAFSLGSRSVLDPVMDIAQLVEPSLEQTPFQVSGLDMNPMQFVQANPLIPLCHATRFPALAPYHL